MRATAVFLLLSGLCHANPLTAEKAVKLRELSDVRWSPDGQRVAFTVRDGPLGKSTARHIWVYDGKTGETRQWTYSAKTEHDPRWSPDGKYLAFISDREDPAQIWMMPVDGGEAVKFTTGKSAITTFRWSPDGTRIAYTAADAKTEAEEKKAKEFDDARVVDLDNKPARLWTIDVATKAVQQQTKGAWAVREFEWMPDGKRMLIVATDQPNAERYTNRIFLLADGKMDEVLAPRGPFQNVKPAPDGASFAFAGARVDGPHGHDLYTCSFNSRKPKNLTAAGVDRAVENYEWMNDAEIAALFANGFHSELNVIGGSPRKLIHDDSVDAYSFAVNQRGSVAYVAGTAARAPELWIDGKQVTHVNRDFDSVPFTKPEFVTYKSFDGLPIEAALFRSEAASNGQAGPFIMLIHGGPTARWSDRVDTLTQLLVAHGYSVMQPNIRGSLGYGHKFIELNRGDWGGADFKDVMAGVDEMIRRNIADPNRLGICGWSYGGYMAEWAITQTDRFKAAVSGAGMADLAVEFGTEANPVYDEWFYGTPYEKPEGFRKSSPITYIRNAKTPTLILQGDADTTDPMSQSQILYRGLKRYNVPAEFVVYPREPHGLREEKHLIDREVRIVHWFDKYLGGSGAVSSASP